MSTVLYTNFSGPIIIKKNFDYVHDVLVEN